MIIRPSFLVLSLVLSYFLSVAVASIFHTTYTVSLHSYYLHHDSVANMTLLWCLESRQVPHIWSYETPQNVCFEQVD